MEFSYRPINSMVSICIEHIAKNLSRYTNNLDTLRLLPPHIKDRFLHRFTSASFFWVNLNFNDIIEALIHPMTKSINLSLAEVDDELLNILQKSHSLNNVYLTYDVNTQITSEALLNFVSASKQLYLLQVPNCLAVNDDVLASVSKHCPMLAGLDVSGCTNITDFGLEEISTLKNLQWLTFSSSQITNKGIEKLVSGPSGKNIKELRLANCKNITSDVVHVIVQYCPKIEVLVFYNLQMNGNHDEEMHFPLQNGKMKNLKQLTWTIPW